MATFCIFDNQNESTEQRNECDHLNLDRQNNKLVASKSFRHELKRSKEGLILTRHLVQDDAVPSGCASQTWKARDELNMLFSIARNGYGNWVAISQNLNDSMEGVTDRQIADHYHIHYVLTDIGSQSWPKKNPKWLAKRFEPLMDDVITTHEEKVNNAFQGQHQLELDHIKYMPKRDEFMYEFDDNAEEDTTKVIISLKNLILCQEDEVEFILAQIDCYNYRLAHRFHIKSIVNKYGHVQKFLNQESTNYKCKSPKKRKTSAKSEESGQFKAAIYPFLRFADEEVLQKLHFDLQREFALKVLIHKLLKYQQNGVTNLEQIKQLELVHKANQNKSKFVVICSV